MREVLDLELRRLERDARAKLQDVGHLLGGRPEGARRALEALLDGSITVTPTNEDGARFHLTGRLVVGSLAVREGDSCGSPKRPYVDEFSVDFADAAGGAVDWGRAWMRRGRRRRIFSPRAHLPLTPSRAWC